VLVGALVGTLVGLLVGLLVGAFGGCLGGCRKMFGQICVWFFAEVLGLLNRPLRAEMGHLSSSLT
jgi:hypothetical protein